jgi:hypothetical protein
MALLGNLTQKVNTAYWINNLICNNKDATQTFSPFILSFLHLFTCVYIVAIQI